MTNSFLRLTLEEVEDTQSPEEGSSLYQLWVHMLNGKHDCLEFSAPNDLLAFSRWSEERAAWIQGWIAQAVREGDFLLGNCSLSDIGEALERGQLVWSPGLGKVFHWPRDKPMSAFEALPQQATAARLDDKLPAPASTPFKARF